ncbi:MAG: hypothetical protein IPL67_16365 [Ignavibacteria bacterium]|nr:hypothetical protein [Ignavibacteria bacterium]
MKHKIRCMLMIALMLQTCFIPMSCMTVESYKGSYLDEEEFSVDKIKSIHLKSGKKYSMYDTQFRIAKLSDDSTYAFVINTLDTTWSEDQWKYSVRAEVDTVMFDDVRDIFIEKSDASSTVLAVLGITGGVLLIAGIVFLVSYGNSY